MKNMNVLIWLTAWGHYHQKNYGATQALLDKINLDVESDEFKQNFELFQEMLRDKLALITGNR